MNPSKRIKLKDNQHNIQPSKIMQLKIKIHSMNSCLKK